MPIRNKEKRRAFKEQMRNKAKEEQGFIEDEVPVSQIDIEELPVEDQIEVDSTSNPADAITNTTLEEHNAQDVDKLADKLQESVDNCESIESKTDLDNAMATVITESRHYSLGQIQAAIAQLAETNYTWKTLAKLMNADYTRYQITQDDICKVLDSIEDPERFAQALQYIADRGATIPNVEVIEGFLTEQDIMRGRSKLRDLFLEFDDIKDKFGYDLDNAGDDWFDSDEFHQSKLWDIIEQLNKRGINTLDQYELIKPIIREMIAKDDENGEPIDEPITVDIRKDQIISPTGLDTTGVQIQVDDSLSDEDIMNKITEAIAVGNNDEYKRLIDKAKSKLR